MSCGILSVSPGAEWHRVLIRAPVTSVGHSEQVFVSLEGFFGRLDPVEDQVIIDDFLTVRRQGWGMNHQDKNHPPHRRVFVRTYRNFNVLLFQLLNIFNLLLEGLSLLVLHCFGNKYVVVQKGSVLRVGETTQRLNGWTSFNLCHKLDVCATCWESCKKKRKNNKKTDSHHRRRPHWLVAVLLYHPNQLQQLNAGLLTKWRQLDSNSSDEKTAKWRSVGKRCSKTHWFHSVRQFGIDGLRHLRRNPVQLWLRGVSANAKVLRGMCGNSWLRWRFKDAGSDPDINWERYPSTLYHVIRA